MWNLRSYMKVIKKKHDRLDICVEFKFGRFSIFFFVFNNEYLLLYLKLFLKNKLLDFKKK